MRYIKAEEVLPGELIREIWKYVDGVTLYIPRNPEKRRDWGSGTPYRRELEERVSAIRAEQASLDAEKTTVHFLASNL